MSDSHIRELLKIARAREKARIPEPRPLHRQRDCVECGQQEPWLKWANVDYHLRCACLDEETHMSEARKERRLVRAAYRTANRARGAKWCAMQK